ncbi:MAG: hypothetical protein GY850_10175 [bacterium]|nr:hypothetical protein [bacterium]
MNENLNVAALFGVYSRNNSGHSSLTCRILKLGEVELDCGGHKHHIECQEQKPAASLKRSNSLSRCYGKTPNRETFSHNLLRSCRQSTANVLMIWSVRVAHVHSQV